jgi:hypothetical protein
VELRAAGLGSVKGVILGREEGVALGCDLTFGMAAGMCNSRQYYLVPAFLWMFLVPFLHLASLAKSVAGPVYPMLQIAIWFTGHLGTLLVHLNV